MLLTKQLTNKEGKELMFQIRKELADLFFYSGKTINEKSEHITWADISQPDVFLSGEFCLLSEYQRGMGSNNIYATIRASVFHVYIKTAWSNFVYQLGETYGEDYIIAYEGAWNGLGRQNVLPPCLQDYDWSGGFVRQTTLTNKTLSYEEYAKFRER